MPLIFSDINLVLGRCCTGCRAGSNVWCYISKPFVLADLADIIFRRTSEKEAFKKVS